MCASKLVLLSEVPIHMDASKLVLLSEVPIHMDASKLVLLSEVPIHMDADFLTLMGYKLACSHWGRGGGGPQTLISIYHSCDSIENGWMVSCLYCNVHT